jgi:hypothetical protein
VQQAGDQGRGVHAQLGEDRGDRERVRDVGVATAPQLPAVALLGDVVGVLQLAAVPLGMRRLVDREQRLEDRLDR